MKSELSGMLRELKDADLFRSMKTLFSPQGREVMIDGRRVLNFCSNDYLGLASDPRLTAAAGEALKKSGFGAGASRLVCGNFVEHAELERDIALMKKAEAALVFSAGYMANVGVISALVGRGDVVYSDRLNHASIIDGAVLSRAELRRYPHNNMQALEELLAKSGRYRRKLIVTDTVFSMDGDVAPLQDVARLAKKHQAWLMVDEAHAFGILGPSGAGLVEELDLTQVVDVQMGTLSKAAGSFGAFVAGSRELIDYLTNTARSVIFTTGMPPSVAAASRAALAIMREDGKLRRCLLELSGRARMRIQDLGLDVRGGGTPIIPVIVKDVSRALEISRNLLDKGILVQAIRPPTVPVGTARLRITLTALHTEDDVSRLVAALKEAVRTC